MDTTGISVITLTAIKNCLFDGSLVSTSWNDSYAGAFIGWGSGTIVFENNFENGTYVNYNHAGMCYHNSSAWGGSATNYSPFSLYLGNAIAVF